MLDIELDHNLDSLLGFLDQSTEILQKPDFREAGIRAVKDFRGQVVSGSFSSLSDATLAIRRKRGKSGSKPLNETGNLASSIEVLRTGKDNLVVGSSLRKSLLLQLGGTTASSSMIPGKKVPSRDFLNLSDSLLDKMIEDMLRKL